MTRQIPLTKGMVALVDDDDFDWLNQWKCLCLGTPTKSNYAARIKREQGARVLVIMHRLILPVASGMFVDHVNRNTFDNRRCNLRQCTRGENNRNSRTRANFSGYRGVHYIARYDRWAAKICCDGKRADLPYRKTAEESALDYDKAARRLHGAFAVLNFPDLAPDRT